MPSDDVPAPAASEANKVGVPLTTAERVALYVRLAGAVKPLTVNDFALISTEFCAPAAGKLPKRL